METVLHDGPRYLYVMGAASGVGKSTVCAGILAWLVANGSAPGRLAYIKPMTQCVEKQPVARFCERMEIAHHDVGRLIYRKGFTKDFIDGLTLGSMALRSRVMDEITEISDAKEIVVIDGVGGPADGSVIGVSNADIAISLPCQVIFVGKSGIGAAIDNTVLCLSFMQNRWIPNIWVIYNNIPESHLDEIKRYVTKRFADLMPDAALLGFIGHDRDLDDRFRTHNILQIAEWFGRHLNTKFLLDAWCGQSSDR